MLHRSARAQTIALVLVSLTASFAGIPREVRADPAVVDNPDGTSTASWNFTNPADYVLANSQIAGGTVSLARQTSWWNSTTAGDFAGPDSATNVDFAGSPGDVVLASTSGPSTLLSLQPGATGEDSWLDETNPTTNRGADTTMRLDGTGNRHRPVLRFDLSSIPAGAVVDGATLNLYQNPAGGNPMVATVYQLTAIWNEAQVTWDDRLTGTAWAAPAGGGDYDPHVIDELTLDNTGAWRAWNITQLVDLWYRGRIANDGLILVASNAGPNSDKYFRSSDYGVASDRPRLDIRYRVLGAVGEYVSRVGGPGTPTAWQAISWNPFARSLVADEFSGASLNPKWSWINLPTAYDVGATVPGHLHVAATVNSEILSGAFTGNALWDVVVGDFTAEMKFDSDPTVSGHKVGLMALLTQRDWFSVGKENVAGVVNWRTHGTVDAVSTMRANAASGNPIPAWVRLVRTGNMFEASTSPDGAVWTLRDTYTPTYEYPLAIRLAFFIATGGSATGLSADVDYLRVTHGIDATVSVATRIGDANPVDGTWSAWSAPYPSSWGSAMAGTSRYADYRLSFSVTYPDHMPLVSDVNISSQSYVPAGFVETMDLVPGDLQEWGTLTVAQALNGESVAYEYSLDSGGNWTGVAPPADLSGVSVASGRTRFRASLSTANPVATPTVSEIRLTYTHRLDHFYVTASASATAGASFTVTVTAKDATNATIVGWTSTVTLAARLLDGVTPGGGVLGTTSLAISAGGTATLATQTYTRAETMRIHASVGAPEGVSDPVVISPGPIARVAVTPPSAVLLPFANQSFTASAFDPWDNPVPGAAFTWIVTNGVGTLNTSAGPTVTLTAQPPVGVNGTVEATAAGVTGIALVSVGTPSPPWVAIAAPAAGAHITGAVSIAFTNSTDAVLVTFEYDAGAGWVSLGNTSSPNGTFPWGTIRVDAIGVVLRARVENAALMTNETSVSPIEIDNTPPTISLGTITDNQATTGTIAIAYATVADVVRVDFTYFDGAWQTIGTDVTVDGSYVWFPGSPINGVTLRAVAVDEVDLAGADRRQGVGTRVVGTNPPAIAAIPTIRVRAGTSYGFNLTAYVTDLDTPLSALGISTSDAVNVTVNAGAYPGLQFLYAAVGTYAVTLWVSDGTDTAWQILQVEASGGNPPALAAPLGIVAFPEDAIAANALGAPLTARFNDADGENLTFAVLGVVQLSWQVNADATLDLWAPANWFGVETVRVRATDPGGAFVEVGLVVTVWAVNDAPMIAPIANLSIGAGGRRVLDLTPFLSDVDNNVSQLLVSTDSPYVTANGRVLTIQFPSDRRQVSFTVSVSDGQATATRLVFVTFLPPWWEHPFLLPVSILPIGLVIAMFARRARWRPAKAFLVDERRELLREFTLDPSCEVTFEQVREAGGLDAVEKAVKVSRYHAQTVKGDALAVTLLAYGPVSIEQIEFAREMLVNVQSKFEEHVNRRLGEARAIEASAEAAKQAIEADRAAFQVKAAAFAGLFEAVTTGQAKIAAESREVRDRLSEAEGREARIIEDVQAIEGRTQELGALQGSLTARAEEIEARDARAADLAATLDARQAQIEALKANLPEREGAVVERENRVASLQRDVEGQQLAVASERQALEVAQGAFLMDRTALEHTQAEFGTERKAFESRMAKSMEDLRLRAQELDSQARILQDAHVKLTEAREGFESMREEKIQWIASKDIELEAKEHTLNEKEAAIRAQAESNAKHLADLAGREEAYEIEGDRLEKLKADLDARKVDLDAMVGALDGKAAEIRDLEARKAEEYRAWQSTMESQSALLKEQQETFERESREAREALVQKGLGIEEHEKDLTDREAKARASVESAMRLEDESKARETASVEAMAVAQDLKSRVDQERGELARTAADLTAREHALQAEAKHQADTMAAGREALKAQEVAAAENRAAAEHAFSDREARLLDAEAEMQGRTDAIEQRSLALLTREGGAEELRASLEREKADLDSLSRTLEARRVELDQITQRNEEEAARLRAETESLQQSVAAREADLLAEKERLERESQSLQDTLGAKAEELAGREKVLGAHEAENGSRSQQLEARSRELETRDRETAAHAEELRGLAATVTDRQTAVEARATQLEAASQAFSAEQEAKRREWESVQNVLRTEEARTKTEAEGRLSQVATKASELHKREQELAAAMAKLEGDRARMAEHAKAIDAREAESAAAWTRAERRIAQMRTLEAEVLRARETFEAERSAWEPRRTEEMKQLEATRDAAGEQAQKAEALLEDAQRRATVAADAERASKRKLEELSQKQLQVEARLKEVERAERATEAQASEIQDATRKLAGREMELATMTKELEARQARNELKSKEVQAASSDARSRRTALDQEAARVSKQSAELQAQQKDIEAKVAQAEARLADVAGREKGLQKLEVEIVTREKALPALERDLEKREWDIATREAALKDRLATADRGRLEVEGLTAKSDEDRRAAAAARVEANVLRESAEKLKAQVENQQAEVAKHMKFLQKKAVETLDRDERIRKTEQELAEREKVLDSQFEILETKVKAMEVEREEEAAKASRLEAEVDRLKSRLADAEKGGAAGADLEERNKDLENRLKVIQRKAMELLDREEKVRLREEAMKERADQLGVKL